MSVLDRVNRDSMLHATEGTTSTYQELLCDDRSVDITVVVESTVVRLLYDSHGARQRPL